MTKQKNELIFSLIFFFFSSFFFLSILSSLFVDNFADLLDILLRPSNLFIQLSRVLLFGGICILIYFTQASIKINAKRRVFASSLGIFIFVALLAMSVWYAPSDDNLDGILDIYDTNNSYFIVNSAKKLIIDSFVFIYFITIPLLGVFYKKIIFDNYFYKTYIKEIAPSINVSIIFLFGYCMKVYDLSVLSIIDFALSLFSIALFARAIFFLKGAITFYNVVNLLILIFGFALIVACSYLLKGFDLYNASLFFYTIGLLYWFLNMLSIPS